jgi:pimeloyl-ACP methyl ester carboxylesterase
MTTFELPDPQDILDLTMEDGAVIRVRRHGNPDGPRIVLAHGNGFAIDAYFPFWRHLTDRFDLAIYDQRNHGWNPRHDDVSHHDVPFFVRDMNRVFDGIRDSFGEKPTAGIFHSISGVTSVWHAYEFGFRWDALVLFDPPLVPSPGHRYHEVARDFELTLAGWSKDRPERFASPDDLAAQFRSSKSLARWIEGSHELMARSILREDKEAGDEAGHWSLCCPPAGESQVYATNSALDLCPRLGDLKGPFKIIASDPDDPHARAPGLVNRALHEEFGHPYEAVPGTTHMLQLEAPEEAARIAAAFLDEAGLGR